jgi:hypothetical protein
MPIARSWAPAVEYKGKIYVIGGCSSHRPQQFKNAVAYLEMYDPATNTWTRLSPMALARVGPAVAVLNGKIYVMGGFDPKRYWSANPTVEIYDIETGRWSPGPSMPTGVSWASAVVLDGKIHVLGGVGQHYYDIMQIFDPSTGEWYYGPSFKGGRYLHAAVAYGGKIYVIGGDTWETGSNVVYNDIQVYDPVSNRWSAKRPMPSPATNLSAVAWEGKIYLFSGNGLARIYDIVSDTWEEVTFPNQDPSGEFSTCVYNGVIYRFGGGGWGPTMSIVQSLNLKGTQEVSRASAGTPPVTPPTLGRPRPTVSWGRTYGGTNENYDAYAIAPTFDGGYVVAGRIGSFDRPGKWDVWVLKLDGQGDVQWQKTYGGPDAEWALAITPTSDGGYIMAGMTRSFGAGLGDVWVLKLDGRGNIQWQKTYGGSGEDSANAIALTSDGGYVVAGEIDSFGAGSIDVWVLKLDGQGDVQWQRTYGGANVDEASAITSTPDGGYIVAGMTRSFGAGKSDIWVLKLDGQGNVEWQKTYGGTGDDVAYAITPTSDGGYVVTGWTLSFGAGLGDVWVLKLDGQGNVQWQKTYGGKGRDEARAIVSASDGGYVLVGMTASFTGSYDAWVLKLDAQGDVQWQKIYGGANYDGAHAIARTGDGVYVMAGKTQSFGVGEGDVWVLKLGADGSIRGCPSGLVRDSTASVASTAVSPRNSSAVVRTSFASGRTSSATVKTTSVSPTPVCRGE